MRETTLEKNPRDGFGAGVTSFVLHTHAAANKDEGAKVMSRGFESQQKGATINGVLTQCVIESIDRGEISTNTQCVVHFASAHVSCPTTVYRGVQSAVQHYRVSNAIDIVRAAMFQQLMLEMKRQPPNCGAENDRGTCECGQTRQQRHQGQQEPAKDRRDRQQSDPGAQKRPYHLQKQEHPQVGSQP